MRVLDLFSGIGGFSLGLERAGMSTAAFCEIDPFCRRVLKKHWPKVRIHHDITKLDGRKYRGIDLICGGFPCQPYSLAGRKKGTADDRDLWPEMCRIIAQARPAWVLGENVAHFTTLAFARTKLDLESLGYAVRAFVIPACAAGANHRRERVWILAHADRAGFQATRPGEQAEGAELRRAMGASFRLALQEWRSVEPCVRRGADGFSNRVDRLKALGNAVVPDIPYAIGTAIMEAEGLSKSPQTNLFARWEADHKQVDATDSTARRDHLV